MEGGVPVHPDDRSPEEQMAMQEYARKRRLKTIISRIIMAVVVVAAMTMGAVSTINQELLSWKVYVGSLGGGCCDLFSISDVMEHGRRSPECGSLIPPRGRPGLTGAGGGHVNRACTAHPQALMSTHELA